MPAGSSVSPSDILDAADDILDKSANLIAAAKTAVDDVDNPNSRTQLTQVFTIVCSHASVWWHDHVRCGSQVEIKWVNIRHTGVT